MDFKKKIEKRGLKLKWVADYINCDYASFRVYINGHQKMPQQFKTRLEKFLK